MALKKNALYIQSGGPTAVINASAYGVIRACAAHSERIGTLFGARYGMVGLLKDDLIDLQSLPSDQVELLLQTPSMAFGSCRYRMTDASVDDADYRQALQTIRKHAIGYLFLNGGNGTLSAALKLDDFLRRHGEDCKVIVIPKTVDNDIECIDHAPGYPSTARHVAITVAELAHDTRSYNTGLITVAEVMGRNSGWIAAAAMAAGMGDPANGPDLIYVPEVPFYTNRFLEDVQVVYAQKGRCLAVVAEGVKDETGKYLFEHSMEDVQNPDLNMGGATPYLTWLLRRHFSCKVRGVDLGLMQRCASHSASFVDVAEATRFGERAVEAALAGVSGMMVSARRVSDAPYRLEETMVDLLSAAVGGNPLPAKFIAENGHAVTPAFWDYLAPLVGELPRHARLDIL